MTGTGNGQPTIQNKTFDEMEVGDQATPHRVLSKDDILLFAAVSGDMNPAHVDEEFARSDLFHKIFPRTLFMTDTGMNVVQDLAAKIGIVQNAVDLLHSLGRDLRSFLCPRRHVGPISRNGRRGQTDSAGAHRAPGLNRGIL